jgi:hypothetical protein
MAIADLVEGVAVRPKVFKKVDPPKYACLLEKLVVDPDAFALTTATPLQRAICRCLDGVSLGDLALDPDVQWAFTGKRGDEALALLAKLPVGVLPAEVILCAAVRCGKTLMSSALAFKACLTVDLSPTRRNESVRYSIAATDQEKASVALEHLMATIPEAPLLRPFFLRDTKSGVIIRHPSGRPIEIRVIVAGRSGAGIIARWSAGLTADEAPRMQGTGKVVNLPDLLRAAHARILPGGQVFMPGAPWAPMGPIFDAVQDDMGKPESWEKGRVVIRGTGPMLNPNWWTPAQIAKELKKPNGILVVQTDCWAQFGDQPTQFFTSDDIARATRAPGETTKFTAGDEVIEVDCLPYDYNKTYAAFVDPATRGNGWSLSIVGCLPGDQDNESIFEVGLEYEWVGTKAEPLKAKKVFKAMKAMLKRYHLDEVWSDAHNFDPNKEHAEEVDDEDPEDFAITLKLDEASQAEKNDRYLKLRTLVVDDCPNLDLQPKRISLPPDPVLRQDMLGIVKELTRTGIRFPLPLTTDGRHADHAPALSGAVDKAGEGAGSWMAAMKRRIANNQKG